MKNVLKIVGFAILGIIILIVLVVGFLFIKNYIESQKPWLEKDYYIHFQSDSELEKKYAGLGNYEVSGKVVKSEDKTVGNIRIWYPSEMDNKQDNYPLIVVTNASNMAALNYEAYFERLASWGFVVVGNDDRQAGQECQPHKLWITCWSKIKIPTVHFMKKLTHKILELPDIHKVVQVQSERSLNTRTAINIKQFLQAVRHMPILHRCGEGTMRQRYPYRGL